MCPFTHDNHLCRGPKDLVETKERLVRQEKEDRRGIVGSLVCRVFQDLL